MLLSLSNCRENHIKAKYKTKAWVTPRGLPASNDFAPIEIKILNDRGQGYRSVSQVRPLLIGAGSVTPKTPTIAVVTRALSTPPTPTKPSVKLPAEKATPNVQSEYPAQAPIKSPRHVTDAPPHAPENREPTDLPGVGWAEKWRERAGISTSPCLQPLNLTGETKSFAAWAKDLHRHSAREHSPQMISSVTKWAPKKPQMHYKVRIPPPSLNQMKMVNTSQSKQQRSSARIGNHPMPLPQRSLPSSVDKAQVPKPVPTIVTSISPSATGHPTSTTETKHQSADQQQSMLVWEGLETESSKASPQSTRQLLPGAYISQTRPLSPPSFPFSQSTTEESFRFHPTLPHTIPFSMAMDISATASTSTHSHNPTETSRQVTTTALPKKDAACVDWNYNTACSVGKDGNCEKLHVCEICESAEHRASQHWHHLATAPLPEIQRQPKLSDLTRPPDSPTLLPVRDRVPLFVPPIPVISKDEGATKAPRVPLFVPPLGISGAQKASAQSERLKLRKRNSARKFSLASVVDTHGEGRPSIPLKDIVQPSRESQRIKIMAPPSSPFDRPVEVILPPAIRPFKTTAADNGDSTGEVRGVPGEGKLRVSAPAFEPSPPRKGSILAGPTSNQFGSLFQIPSPGSHRLEIVAPRSALQAALQVSEHKTRQEVVPSDSSWSIVQPQHKANGSRSVSRNRRKRSADRKDLNDQVAKVEADELIDAGTRGQRGDFRFGQGHGTRAPTTEKAKATLNAKPGAILADTPSSKLDRSVLKILDEQLEAIIGKESEETIAKTLETIIEICSTSEQSSTTPSPRSDKLDQNQDASTTPELLTSDVYSSSGTGIPTLRPPAPPSTAENLTKISPLPTTIQANTVQIPDSLTRPLKINHFFTLDDFADNDVFFESTKPMQSRRDSKQRYGDESNRPRSSDSSSTAPIDPIGSPRSHANMVDLQLLHEYPASLVDQEPLKGRIERMMSCAAARGAGQCNCGLGNWFHHSRV
jgi:hypothetical protein